ncbi:MAG: DEAD/DEAH box helicase family protein, partial [Bacteroidales bacterium]|nr:DEAD/DEAH box helicase family protein [Bacteroidales bacterium]
MNLQLDANQEYQLKAVRSGVDIFKGQANNGGFRFEVSQASSEYLYNSCFVVGNRLELEEKAILENIQAVQGENGIDLSTELDGLNFSFEMETGTGKTYVYLRMIHELSRQYGFKKFIV